MTTKRDACDCLACKTSDGEACERASRSYPPLAESGAEELVDALIEAAATWGDESSEAARSALLAHLARVEARAETAEAALNAEREPNGYPIASAETWRLRVCELERSLAAAEARAAEAERVANENAEAGFRAVAKLREAEERERGLREALVEIRDLLTEKFGAASTAGTVSAAIIDRARAALSRSPSQPEGGGDR